MDYRIITQGFFYYISKTEMYIWMKEPFQAFCTCADTIYSLSAEMEQSLIILSLALQSFLRPSIVVSCSFWVNVGLFMRPLLPGITGPVRALLFRALAGNCRKVSFPKFEPEEVTALFLLFSNCHRETETEGSITPGRRWNSANHPNWRYCVLSVMKKMGKHRM